MGRPGWFHMGYIYGLSGLWLGVDRPGGFHMGYIWAKSAWARTGQPCQGPIWAMHGLSGMAQN